MVFIHEIVELGELSCVVKGRRGRLLLNSLILRHVLVVNLPHRLRSLWLEHGIVLLVLDALFCNFFSAVVLGEVDIMKHLLSYLLPIKRVPVVLLVLVLAEFYAPGFGGVGGGTLSSSIRFF